MLANTFSFQWCMYSLDIHYMDNLSTIVHFQTGCHCVVFHLGPIEWRARVQVRHSWGKHHAISCYCSASESRCRRLDSAVPWVGWFLNHSAEFAWACYWITWSGVTTQMYVWDQLSALIETEPGTNWLDGETACSRKGNDINNRWRGCWSLRWGNAYWLAQLADNKLIYQAVFRITSSHDWIVDLLL